MKSLLSLLPLALFAVGEDAQTPLGQVLGAKNRALSFDSIPPLGFGTWNLKEKNASEAVSWAIQVGYRHIDAAAIYGNEHEVGIGIADGLAKTGLRREDIWVTSKLWNNNHDINNVESALDTTLMKLGVGYLDLYHMHWPVADGFFGGHSIDYVDTWTAMELLIPKGKVRQIGVCNFSPSQLNTLINRTGVYPSVHQMELHPYLAQKSWIDWHNKHNIRVTAYSPLAGSNPTYDPKNGPVQLLNNTVIRGIASKRDCTPAQVALKWALARGTSVIPKSIHKNRIEENYASIACKLSHTDVVELDELGEQRKRYNNPGESWGVELFEGLEDAKGKREKANFTAASVGGGALLHHDLV